jgi:hypothetical protein
MPARHVSSNLTIAVLIKYRKREDHISVLNYFNPSAREDVNANSVHNTMKQITDDPYATNPGLFMLISSESLDCLNKPQKLLWLQFHNKTLAHFSTLTGFHM